MTGRYVYLDDGSKIFLDEYYVTEEGKVTGQFSGTKATKTSLPLVNIPVSEGKDIAKKYGFDQVVIIARRIGEGGGESVTTYGKDKVNCDIAARIGHFLKYKIMQWDWNEERGHND